MPPGNAIDRLDHVDGEAVARLRPLAAVLPAAAGLAFAGETGCFGLAGAAAFSGAAAAAAFGSAVTTGFFGAATRFFSGEPARVFAARYFWFNSTRSSAENLSLASAQMFLSSSCT